MNDKFCRYFAERYSVARLSFPGEGRRKWRLRVMEDLWLASEVQAEIASAALDSQETPGGDADNDGDPLDDLTEGEEVGLLVRTDFSNNAAWEQFVNRMQSAEKEILAAITSGEGDSTLTENNVEMEGDASESDSEPETAPGRIIRIIEDPENSLFNGISNLTALRLLNDVGIRATPTPPPGTCRINSGNRLVDQNGLQEIYRGKTIWIYDGNSNADESVRLVSQQGDVYGTATGDSWRARASHVAELQFNMTYYNMKIDFGGLDRWEYSERMRNLSEAENR